MRFGQLVRRVVSPALPILFARPRVVPVASKLVVQVGMSDRRVARRRLWREVMVVVALLLTIAAISPHRARAPERIQTGLVAYVAHGIARVVGVESQRHLVDHISRVDWIAFANRDLDAFVFQVSREVCEQILVGAFV